MTAEEVAAARAEAEAQRKADARWRPLLLKWKGWLAQESRRAEAESALAGVDDPRAVPAIWRAFALGGPADQERAIDMLGRLEGERPTRALAGLAIYGKTETVRRAGEITTIEFDPGAQHAGEGRGFSAWKLILKTYYSVFRRQHVVARHAAQRVESFLFSESLRAREAARAHQKWQRANSEQSNTDENQK